MKYVVIEVHESYVVVLDQAGTFSLALNFNYQLGDQIDAIIPYEDITTQEVVTHKRRKWIPRFAVLSVCIALILFIIPTFNTPVAAASIWLSYNPEYRIDIDTDGNILEVEGLNPDAVEALESMNCKHKSYIDFANAIIDYGMQNDTLVDGKTIEVYIDTDDQKLYDSISNNLELNLNEKLCHKEIDYEIEHISKKHERKQEQHQNQGNPSTTPDEHQQQQNNRQQNNKQHNTQEETHEQKREQEKKQHNK
ncbi:MULTISPECIES: hypothetical protein [unclassified Breznakia]|uniref:anti-sigma-I factor RsgI family protein n=1 Tax=unclassified Breznakia TaxID=2623764 RepID=UPI0024743A06|nr:MULTISPECIES: hypothetical protein [unclassified Breznakia]MDH6367307.1 hypothetical protein [Breznakia sp. PH1-1]MDH6404545.1 hypothetical protein [Breznakia sp. PF1-11]MDH6412254.1 hypothetical protein [Breznakia sp. PFB1-11]MDH6414474.1 hypothetical protein [Breznakia sp. PFB1-14]MDH6416918.1 hypothetical protein [Breznakia sp. PFB1-4]